jgi:hypothetical protein
VLSTSFSEPPLVAVTALKESVVGPPHPAKAPTSTGAAAVKRNPPVEWAQVAAAKQHSAEAAVAAQVVVAAQP